MGPGRKPQKRSSHNEAHMEVLSLKCTFFMPLAVYCLATGWVAAVIIYFALIDSF